MLDGDSSPSAVAFVRTGLSAITDVDAYIRTLSGGTGATGYGNLSYTKSTNPQGGDFDANKNYHYVIAITPEDDY